MIPIIHSPPVIEPITVDEAKAHLRIDVNDEDELLSTLITAARAHLEVVTRRLFITQGWLVFFDQWPKGAILNLPFGPIQSIDGVRLHDEAGAIETVAPTIYLFDPAGVPPRLILRSGQAWPKVKRRANGIEVELTGGYGDGPEKVPAPLRHAVLQYVAHWFEHRDPVASIGADVEMPAMISSLIAPYRTLTL